MRSRCGRGEVMFIERTEVFKGNLPLSVFVQTHKQTLNPNAQTDPKSMTGRDRPRSKAYHLDSHSPLSSHHAGRETCRLNQVETGRRAYSSRPGNRNRQVETADWIWLRIGRSCPLPTKETLNET